MLSTRFAASLTTAKASGNILSKASFSSFLSSLKSEDVGRFDNISLNSFVFSLKSSSESTSNSGSKALIWSIIPAMLFIFCSLEPPISFIKKSNS